MDPLSVSASVAQLLAMGGDAVSRLRRAMPEYGRFWKIFENQLVNEHDIPWDEIRSRSYLQPDFVGWAIAYMGGDDSARIAMEGHFAKFIEPPPRARETREQIITRVNAAARVAANTAVASDRKAELANSQLVIAAIDRAARALSEQQAATHERVENIQVEMAVNEAARQGDTAALREQIKELERRLAGREHATAQVIESRLEEMLERTTNVHEPGGGLQASRPPAATDVALEKPFQREQLELLRREDADAAARIDAVVGGGGVSALVTAIRAGDLETGPLALLITVGRIVAFEGRFADAEEAYLQASRLDLSDALRARQLIRATRAASMGSAPERADEHLDAARQLSPNLPAVVITEARALHDSAAVLSQLRDVEPQDDDERAVLHQTRALAHLNLNDEAAADGEVELARAADPDHVAIREFEATRLLGRVQARIAQGNGPDRAEAADAGARFAALADEMAEQRRPNETAWCRAQASECLMLAGRVEEAQALMATMPSPDLLREDIAIAIARAAMVCQCPDIVLLYAPADADNVELRLVRAEAQAIKGGDEDSAQARGVLRDLLTHNRVEIRQQAAFALLVSAAFDERLPWDEDVATVVRCFKPETEAGLRAERHHLLGDDEAAERLLLSHAQRIPMLRRLRDLAAERGQWDKAADRSRQLVRAGDDPSDRLALGVSLGHVGGRDEALIELLRVARDRDVTEYLRGAAFLSAVEVVGRDRDYASIRDLSAEWSQELPDSIDARWNLVFGLARLSEHQKAYELVREADLEPKTSQQATLLAEIYYRAAPRVEAIRLIAALSDRFVRELEPLEGLIIAAMLAADQTGETITDPALVARVRETLTTFETRFPDSTAFRTIRLPGTADELQALMRELAGDGPELQRQTAAAVRDGHGPVNTMAAVLPGTVATVWARLEALPLGFAVPEIDATDRQAALAAIGGAAIWDPSSLTVVATALGRDVREAIVGALPGSFIVPDTLEDVDADPVFEGHGVAEGLRDGDGGFVMRTIGEHERETDAERLAASLALAKRLDVRPSLGESASRELLAEYEEPDNRPELLVLLGTILAAQRNDRPVYSDDRWIREYARAQGVPAFGTLALLDALTEREMIDAQTRSEGRRALAARGAWGVALTATEMIDEARVSEFEVSPTLAGAITDRATWRARPAERWRDMVAFFAVVHDKRPERFRLWVQGALQAAHAASPPLAPSWFLNTTLLMAWGLGDETQGMPRSAFQALVDETKRLPPTLTTLGHDPVLGAMSYFLSYFVGYPEHERFIAFAAMVRRLRFPDQQRAFEYFVAPQPSR